jgi:hypothetical protein
MPMFVAAIPALLGSVATAAGTGATAIGATGLGAGLASAGSALGGLATSIGGATAGGLGLGSLASGILGGTATAFSALSSLRAGQQQRDAYRQAATDAQLEATNEELQGQRREIGLKNELSSKLGSISSAYAAAGIDLSYGAAETARATAGTKADQELTMDRATTEMRKARLNQRAGSYLGMAREARASSILQAAGQAASGGLRIANRG